MGKEIDRMALQGVNLPLMAVNSQYAVWQNTLKRLGYNEKEISEFFPEPVMKRGGSWVISKASVAPFPKNS